MLSVIYMYLYVNVANGRGLRRTGREREEGRSSLGKTCWRFTGEKGVGKPRMGTLKEL